MHTCTPPPAPQLQSLPVPQGPVGISLRRWKMNWETQSWYAVISMHNRACGTSMATNQQGRKLEEVLSNLLFTPVSTASPTHSKAQQGDTDSTIDLALVSPKLTPWTQAEILASHRSDHLPIVFSLQKPGMEPRWKHLYLFKCGKSDTGVMTKLWAHKPACTTIPREIPAIQSPWWNKETQAVWTDKRKMVKWQKERSKGHPDLMIKVHMEEKTEVFKRVVGEAKDRRWKSFSDTQQRCNIYSLLAILLTDGGLHCQHHPHPHRCKRSSTEDKQGKGLSTTPTLRPAEQSEQTGWKESSLERAEKNPNRNWLKWWPDHSAGIHWSTFWTEHGYSSWIS